MAKRVTRQYLTNANRHQLKAYLKSLGHETYPDESTEELRDTSIAIWEQSLSEESPELYADVPAYGLGYMQNRGAS